MSCAAYTITWTHGRLRYTNSKDELTMDSTVNALLYPAMFPWCVVCCYLHRYTVRPWIHTTYRTSYHVTATTEMNMESASTHAVPLYV